MTEADKPFFDEDKQKKAIEWVTSKCGELKCECCGSGEWSISPEITAPTIFRNGMMLGGNISPMFTLVCMNCANTKFFNAIVAKVVVQEKKDGEDGD